MNTSISPKNKILFQIIKILFQKIAVFSLLIFIASQAQIPAPTPFDLGRSQDIAARPMALGGSYTAVASDASALYYNAAGLSAVKKHEIAATLERTALFGIDLAHGYPTHRPQLVDMCIQSLSYLLPIPTSRGGLTFAFGYSRPRTFSDVLRYQDSLATTRGNYDYEAVGTQNQYRAGMGLDISPDITFGMALGYLGGQESVRVQDSSLVGYLRTYHGLNLEPSLMVKVTPRMRLGLSLVLWEKIISLQELYEVKGQSDRQTNYQAENPFQLKMGWSYQGDDFLLAADCRLNSWSQYQFGLEGASVLEKAGYKDEVMLSLGAEKLVKPLNMVVRGGYTLNTLPETNFKSTYDLSRFSAGVGFLTSGSLSIDLAYSYAFWGTAGDGLTMDNQEHRALMTFAYRY